jgi:hypothetical protein
MLTREEIVRQDDQLQALYSHSDMGIIKYLNLNSNLKPCNYTTIGSLSRYTKVTRSGVTT